MDYNKVYDEAYKEAFEKSKKAAERYIYLSAVSDGAMTLENGLKGSGLEEPEFIRAMAKTIRMKERLEILQALIINKKITEDEAIRMFDVTHDDFRAYNRWNAWFDD